MTLSLDGFPSLPPLDGFPSLPPLDFGGGQLPLPSQVGGGLTPTVSAGSHSPVVGLATQSRGDTAMSGASYRHDGDHRIIDAQTQSGPPRDVHVSGNVNGDPISTRGMPTTVHAGSASQIRGLVADVRADVPGQVETQGLPPFVNPASAQMRTLGTLEANVEGAAPPAAVGLVPLFSGDASQMRVGGGAPIDVFPQTRSQPGRVGDARDEAVARSLAYLPPLGALDVHQ